LEYKTESSGALRAEAGAPNARRFCAWWGGTPPTRRKRVHQEHVSVKRSKLASGLERSDSSSIKRGRRAEAAHAPKRALQEQEKVKRSKTRKRFGAKRQQLDQAGPPR